MTNVEKAIELQARVNKQIDTYGSANLSDMDELLELCDNMTPEESDEFILRAPETVEDTFNHDMETQSELNWMMNAMLGK